MRKRMQWVVPILVSAAIGTVDCLPLDAQTDAVSAGVQDVTLQHGEGPRQYDGPALSLPAALDEALAKNPEVLALRAQLPVVRTRSAQERALMPPTLEATVWQWPMRASGSRRTRS
jgi:hypothetical protein